MRKSFKFLGLVTAISMGGCIYYVQAPPPSPEPAPVVENIVTPSPPPAPPPAPQPAVVEYQPPPPEVAPVYQDDLAPYGRWFFHPRYGRCWIPYGTPYGWQPYTIGHWIYTDDGACCWVSEDREVAWGAIVYHYGQWEFTPDMGWIWVPGTTWAPAWVAWRDGGGYCGWTPLPPEACYQPQVTVVVIDRYCPPDRYVYVNEVNINDRYDNRHDIRNNVTIINNTTNITNITVVNNRVINRGVPADELERRTGRHVERVAVAEATSPEDARRLALNGQPVRYTSNRIDQAHVVEAAALVQAQKKHDAQLQQQLNREEQMGKKEQLQLDNQEKKDQQLQKEHDAAKARQDQLDAERKQEKQAAEDRLAEHDKQVAAEQEAARQKQAEREQQVAAQKQAEHDREVQRQQAAEAARQQAAREKADAEKTQADKPSVKKPKPGQPANPPPPQ